MTTSQRRVGLALVIIYSIMIAAMYSIAPANAADDSPAAQAQAIQCTVFAGLAGMDEDTIRIHRGRVPKEFGLTDSYNVGLAEGRVYGFASSRAAENLSEHRANRVASAEAHYTAEGCTTAEWTSLR